MSIENVSRIQETHHVGGNTKNQIYRLVDK